MYSQILKYELNDISFYRSYACLINIFNSYIFNSFLKRGLSLRVFIFMHFYLYSFQIKNVILFFRTTLEYGFKRRFTLKKPNAPKVAPQGWCESPHYL